MGRPWVGGPHGPDAIPRGSEGRSWQTPEYSLPKLALSTRGTERCFTFLLPQYFAIFRKTTCIPHKTIDSPPKGE